MPFEKCSAVLYLYKQTSFNAHLKDVQPVLFVRTSNQFIVYSFGLEKQHK
uniref:Uncharacterized protein n=1 Tax=Manihot esculenta TaxID=3983 RepID=A0A2C9V8N5_MANES